MPDRRDPNLDATRTATVVGEPTRAAAAEEWHTLLAPPQRADELGRLGHLRRLLGPLRQGFRR